MGHPGLKSQVNVASDIDNWSASDSKMRQTLTLVVFKHKRVLVPNECVKRAVKQQFLHCMHQLRTCGNADTCLFLNPKYGDLERSNLSVTTLIMSQ